MTRLSRSALASAGHPEPAPSPESLRTGVVHLGIGAFARAHTAVYTQEAMRATGETRWGLSAATLRSDAVARQLAPQDCLYTVSERGEGAAPLRLVSAVREVLTAPTQPHEVAAHIAAPETAVVTLTITEKGYRVDPATGGLAAGDPAVAADLAAPERPTTPVGLLARGLALRGERGGGPLSVVSCDNLPSNGAVLRRLVEGFADALPAQRARPLREQLSRTTFPSTMVDRITPATTEADLAAVAEELGLRDEAAVVAEPFRQWVVQDDFAGERPAWELAGAVLTDDVEPWETCKLRVLNASHSLLAHLGEVDGARTIAEAVSRPTLLAVAQRFVAEDVVPTLHVPRDLDVAEYGRTVLGRFANPALAHTSAQVGSDGSQKLVPRVVAPAAERLRAGAVPRWHALLAAAWMLHVARTPAAELADPLADLLTGRLGGSRRTEDVVPALLGSREVFTEEVGASRGFADAVTRWYALLASSGTAGLEEELHRDDA
ncbi:mannitol dehydrogenase family protein [uncultured Pseudokineococcus sp.]|uniref:mannitol dehydrogenase family protein n=1 Tax=uncultured Pseudokineococcus sp. TaxID=1642928 RepID=UPI0026268832|nr:mannitol dehydrogenase family protein [uncultured Pseudokineococcus sp.]